MNEPNIEYHAHDVVVATWSGHVFAAWTAAPTVAGVGALAAAVAKCQRGGGAPVYFGTIAPGVGLPEEPARVAFVRALQSFHGRVPAVALVVRGEGFGASAVRGVITGFGLAVRTDVAVRSFPDVAAAARWLAPRAAPALDETALAQAARQVEAEAMRGPRLRAAGE